METLVESGRTEGAAVHPLQDRALTLAFGLAEGWMHRRLGEHKRELFGGLARTVLEIGAGTGIPLPEAGHPRRRRRANGRAPRSGALVPGRGRADARRRHGSP